MRTWITALLLGSGSVAFAQPTEWLLLGNNGTTAGTNFLATDDAVRLTVRTDDSWRLQVNESESYNIDAFSLMPADGFVGISPDDAFWSTAPYGPFGRLHLAEGREYNTQTIGYRPWMRNGINFTGNNDQMYIGQKYTYDDPEDHTSGELLDYTDAIIQWSDNPGTWLSDRMRFIFTSEYSSMSTTGNASLEGLEAMQLYPHDDGSEVFVGIGDWFAAGVSPSERLDVLNRTIRIRRLVPDYEDTGLDYDKVMVTDDDGRIHWRPISTLDCEWSMSGSSPNHVYTAVGSASATCPDEVENVGIGTASPAYKLHVVDDTPVSSTTRAIHALATGGTAGNTCIAAEAEADNGTASTAVWALAYNGSATCTGISGVANVEAGETSVNIYGVRGNTEIDVDATVTEAFGVHGQVSTSTGTITNARGVYGRAEATATRCYGVEGTGRNGTTVNYGGRFEATSTTAGTNYGVFASANSSTTANWAGWFSGDINVTGQGFIPGNLWTPSDAMFKTNVEPLINAVDVIAQLDAHTYDYLEADFPMMDLPSGNQGGLIAQELELVLPSLVTETTFPAQYDDQGNQTSAASE
ncbi:MAG: tail fiber domain-containing protein [Flavobacteriales bacterium]|nr:tail fiber domain-containing protein [Flavobacteriales bacterium]